jgi:hypothetical protein
MKEKESEIGRFFAMVVIVCLSVLIVAFTIRTLVSWF